MICLGFTRICREIGDVEIYALYSESFRGENLAIRKVNFSDSVMMMAMMAMMMVMAVMMMQFFISQGWQGWQGW